MVVLADRRTQTESHTILCAKRDKLEATIDEQHAFKAITAQGDYGSSTEFTNIDSLERSLTRTLDKIAVLERQLEL